MAKTDPISRHPAKLPLALSVIIALVFILAEVFTEGWYRWHEMRTADNPTWSFRWPDALGSPGHVRDFQEYPVAGGEVLHFDRSRGATWLDAHPYRWMVTVLEWNPGKKVSAMDARHNPTICLPSVGLELVRELGEIRVPTAAGEITLRGYEFRRGEATPYVFSASIRRKALPDPEFRSGKWERRITQFERALFGNRQSPERILLIAVEGPRSPAEAEQALWETLPDWVKVEKSSPVLGLR